MDKIILDIKQAIEKTGLSEAKAAKLAGLNQNKVNRMLSGMTKKIDLDAVQKLHQALGMVAEQGLGYASDKPFQVVQEIVPEKKKASSPLAAAILALVEAMSPEQQAAELKRLTDQFTSSQTTEKS